MRLLEMKEGQIASIDALYVNGELKKRLNSLGFIKENNISLKKFGLFKSTVQIMINRSLIALRKEEARLIEVHLI